MHSLPCEYPFSKVTEKEETHYVEVSQIINGDLRHVSHEGSTNKGSLAHCAALKSDFGFAGKVPPGAEKLAHCLLNPPSPRILLLASAFRRTRSDSRSSTPPGSAKGTVQPILITDPMPRGEKEPRSGPASKRQRASEDAHVAEVSESPGRPGRHVSKTTRACDSCKVCSAHT